eukprot:SAG31_NODE_16674_length_700_cov_1.222962_1_plen_154_part_10
MQASIVVLGTDTNLVCVYTVREMKIGAHGTLCKLPLGDSAIFSFRYTESISCTIEYELRTDKTTEAAIVLPAHEFDVSFTRTEPSYSAVTDASDYGYLFRMRQRTQRIDLTEPAGEASETEAQVKVDAENGKGTSAEENEHSLHFEFRAAPTLE